MESRVTAAPTPYIIGVTISSVLLLLLAGLVMWMRWHRQQRVKQLQKRGQTTEALVNRQVQFWAYRNNAMHIAATMFKYDHNKIFEVDGVLITQRALIALEVKSIAAELIIGKGNEKNWFKVVNGEKIPIKSPVVQNDNHLNHIVTLTGMKVPMVSLVVFDAEAVPELELSDLPGHVLVIRSDQIQQTLDAINSFLLPKITAHEVQNLYFKLMDHRSTSREDQKLLVTYAKEFTEKTFTI